MLSDMESCCTPSTESPLSSFSGTNSEEWTTSGSDDKDKKYIQNVNSLLLGRFPSFVPLQRHDTSLASLDLLVPSPESDLRNASMLSATFNMIATIIGGGVLSVPLSFARAGLIPATIMMVVAAVMTDFSLCILCSSARMTGSTSYAGAARHAFGPLVEVFSTALIFLYLIFILVAFMILVKGIWSPIIVNIILGETPNKNSQTLLSCWLKDLFSGSYTSDAILAIALVLISPYFLRRDLHGLRYQCYAGFVSISVLCIAMVYRAIQKNLTKPTLFQTEGKVAASAFVDVLSAFPIILLAFLCSFNVISVHCALIKPSRKRIHGVVHASISLSFFLMYTFGLAGYLYAYGEVNGNILLNFDPSDKIILLGRVGCGICTLLAMPMNLLPCREALLSLIAQLDAVARSSERKRPSTTASEEHWLLDGHGESVLLYDSLPKEGIRCISPIDELAQSEESSQAEHRDKAVHCGSTFAIIMCCYVCSVLAPGVAIVWDICGSSMGFGVQYIIPAACYVKLRARREGPTTIRTLSAWALLVISTIGAILCTAQTAWRLIFTN